ncbi:MAG: cysteine-rich KTR domain-containing protein [Firmicutes bacterium]|nr:cysteine-rich KTR domain-containing protein [Bacillota bacterium]
MSNEHLLLCPVCKGKTRTKVNWDTVLINFPLFCPKCKQETLVNVQQQKISVIKVPAA